jgi:hypothetical protein
MALYQVDIEKALGTESWTNVYHVDAASAGAAAAQAALIIAAEIPVHCTIVNFVAHRVRLAGSGHVGSVTTVNTPGTRTIPTNMLPMFNVVRADFANGAARPARKYLRGGLLTGDVDPGFLLKAATITLFQTYCNSLMSLGTLRDPQGRTLSSGAPRAVIAMHQLRRGNRQRPVI